ncbi:MAG: hypothetical protein V1744_02095 [Candidatus Altiarchaeota archaeon]
MSKVQIHLLSSITRARNSNGFGECLHSSREGGKIAKNARVELEKKTGRRVVSRTNYLGLAERKKLKKYSK